MCAFTITILTAGLVAVANAGLTTNPSANYQGVCDMDKNVCRTTGTSRNDEFPCYMSTCKGYIGDDKMICRTSIDSKGNVLAQCPINTAGYSWDWPWGSGKYAWNVTGRPDGLPYPDDVPYRTPSSVDAYCKQKGLKCPIKHSD